MKIKNIFGKEINKSFSKYSIDWERKVSKPQKRVKGIIRPYWEAQNVYEELYIPNSRLRVDLINFSTNTVVEISPKQHQEYNEFLHGSRLKYLEAQKRDLQKIEWCEVNGFSYVEIDEGDLKKDDDFILQKILDR